MYPCEIIKKKKGKERLKNWVTGEESKSYDKIYGGGPYFKTREGELFGVITKNKVVCEPIYQDICISQLFLFGFCRVKTYSGYGLINTEGLEILDASCEKVVVYDERFVEFVRNGRQFIAFPQRKKVYEQHYTKINITEDWIKVYDENNYQGLYSMSGKKLFDLKYLEIYQIDRNFYKAITVNGGEILNAESWAESSGEWKKIFPESQGYLRVESFEGSFNYISKQTGENLSTLNFNEGRDFSKTKKALVRISESGPIQLLDQKGKVYGRGK